MEPGLLLFALLSQAAPVTALVGPRIYPLRAPEGQPRPYVLYQLISRVPDGAPACHFGDVARVQLSLFADSYAQVSALAAACRAVLHFAQPAPDVFLELDNEQDHYHDQALCYFKSQDYLLELPA